ncbi:uncharacterized protein BP01DRAFT_379498 [Aspergillus saccharolyticus JOP 1030-1]|uniref:MFS general substrate transporter n=1 Tax=Aspergillus saccharolyticus JOP 1030-1 TaxID=1450539 RepID=A0A318ZRA0_9EURO|nr:hypothetical protein BP01DRAFT_379498 [Aspergillus saccharolyticus JOP 1030-1]PYH49114.1 hypothetical protein BP01DRAFT_379498 [Aspergillus saccharolyticus JOP 1030-1]
MDALSQKELDHAENEVNYSIPQKVYWQKLAPWSNSLLSFGQVVKHCYRPFLIMFSIPALFTIAIEYGVVTASDSVVALTVVRDVISTIIVFALQPWVDRVGLNRFYVTLGLITMAIMIGNLLFIYSGKTFRVKPAGRYRHFAA